MAKRLEAFPEGLRQRATSPYPWHEWLDGSVWELTRGEDFPHKVKSFRTNAQAKARAKGGRLRSALTADGNGVVIQYIPPTPLDVPLAAVPDPPSGPAPEGTPPAAGPAPAGPPSAAGREESRAIRAWAKSHGWPDLSEFGRMPTDVLVAYERAKTHPHGGVV